MKKTFAVVAALFMLLMLPVFSFSATPGPYVSGQFGMAFLTDSDISSSPVTGTVESDLGFATGFAGGYNFGMFRVEGEIGYQLNGIDKANLCLGGICLSGISPSGDTRALSFLVNGYFDFVNKTAFTPYITAGIGMTRLDVNDFAVELPIVGSQQIGDSDDTVFAYQVGTDLVYTINRNFTIDLKYRYFATADPEFDGIKAEFASHNVYLGLRVNF